MIATIFCGCFIIGICLLWADFGSQLYWLWVTPDARVGWVMSSERMELMRVPQGGCLSFDQGIASKFTTFKIHQLLAVQTNTGSLKHITHNDIIIPRCFEWQILFLGRFHLDLKIHILGENYRQTYTTFQKVWMACDGIQMAYHISEYYNVFWTKLILECLIFFIQFLNNVLLRENQKSCTEFHPSVRQDRHHWSYFMFF